MALASLLAFGSQVLPTVVSTARAAGQPLAPKAVFIVGPTNALTESNLADAARMAYQAEAEGMDVRRVFFPDATWENVLANVQGASLVVYMGHGYGWPSPYTTRLTESRQNGFGLNAYPGSGRAAYTYYGARPIRENIRLAPNAVVMLLHGCYTAGNGEPGMAIPTEDIARERVDNFASGFLAAGAGAVFAFGWDQSLNYPRALATTNSTMDELFMTRGGGSPAGFIGWRDARFESARTPGADTHLDPHPISGYYRSLTGDLAMTAADWRAGAGVPPDEPPATDAPQITQLVAGSDGASDIAAAVAEPTSFSPNGDGLADVLFLHHTVTRATYLDVTIRNDAGDAVRTLTSWSVAGGGISSWDGRDARGDTVPDGRYSVTCEPRAPDGTTGDPVSVAVLVLTAISVANATKQAVHVSDGDSLARFTSFKVVLNQPALLTWRIVDGAGRVVRSIRDGEHVPPGALAFSWDGRNDHGAWVTDGVYRSVVSAQTGLGEYSAERRVLVGAFLITSSNAAPTRGERLTVNLVSTESLDRSPTVRVIQDGVPPWTVTARHVSGRRYRASIVLQAGGPPGSVQIQVTGVDTRSGVQSSSVSFPLQ